MPLVIYRHDDTQELFFMLGYGGEDPDGRSSAFCHNFKTNEKADFVADNECEVLTQVAEWLRLDTYTITRDTKRPEE